MLASCGKDGADTKKTSTIGDGDVAYMSISVTTPTSERTRSTELNASTDESTINTLYAITFDENKQLVHHNKENPVMQLIALNTKLDAPKAVRVSTSAKYLVIIANPGPQLKNVMNGLTQGTAYSAFNSAVNLTITAKDKREILVNEIRKVTNAAKGSGSEKYENFAMINSGDIGADGLEEIAASSLYVVGTDTNQYKTEAEAEKAANDATSKQKIKIERLTAKMLVKAATTIEIPQGASFVFNDWTLDVLNSTYFPYAEKVAINAAHTPGSGFYTNNFYTVDPNYADNTGTSVDESNAGLMYNKLAQTTLEPNVTWLNPGNYDYCIENTMTGEEQVFKNATRVVIRGTYYPVAGWTGDWFSFGGHNYENFNALQAAYNEAVAGSKSPKLVEACDNFYTDIAAAAPALVTGGASDFASLTQAALISANIPNGGEVVKRSTAEGYCLKWYQNGRNYYYYEIRHDNTVDTYMALGKYGVVRNNFYELSLNKVKGSGTPWYPAVNPDPDPDPDPKDPDKPVDPKPDPDPEGPDPEEPIDDIGGYISFEIEVGPWISWTTGMEI